MKKHNTIKPKSNNTENISDFQKKLISKENPFKVPEHYFENLPYEIQDKIMTKKTLKLRKISFSYRFVYATTIAAAIIIILFIFSLLITKKVQKNDQLSYISHYEDVITEYLEDNLDENTLIELSSDSMSLFDPEEMPEISLSDDFITKKQINETEFKFDTTINKSEIIEYLINENIDPETL